MKGRVSHFGKGGGWPVLDYPRRHNREEDRDNLSPGVTPKQSRLLSSLPAKIVSPSSLFGSRSRFGSPFLPSCVIIDVLPRENALFIGTADAVPPRDDPRPPPRPPAPRLPDADPPDVQRLC